MQQSKNHITSLQTFVEAIERTRAYFYSLHLFAGNSISRSVAYNHGSLRLYMLETKGTFLWHGISAACVRTYLTRNLP